MPEKSGMDAAGGTACAKAGSATAAANMAMKKCRCMLPSPAE
jgi:hypothetical protein